MCKLFVSEKCFEIADKAVQIHGNVGVTRNHPVEFIFRRLRMYRIVTGTSEIQRNTVGLNPMDAPFPFTPIPMAPLMASVDTVSTEVRESVRVLRQGFVELRDEVRQSNAHLGTIERNSRVDEVPA